VNPRRYRFPQMAVCCSWCHAPVGELCTSHRGRVRGDITHQARRSDWVTATTTCTAADCQAGPGHPCTAGNTALVDGIHPDRDAAADRAAAATTP
jgi:hypothetical protein